MHGFFSMEAPKKELLTGEEEEYIEVEVGSSAIRNKQLTWRLVKNPSFWCKIGDASSPTMVCSRGFGCLVW